MILNYIMILTMYPTMLIVALVYKYSMKNKSRLVFGVHLPKDLVDGPEVKEAERRFKHSFRLILVVLLALPPCFFLFHHVSLQFTAWMIWFMAALVVMILPYIAANKAMMKLKTDYLEKLREASGEADAENTVVHDAEHKTDNKPVQYVETEIVRTVKRGDYVLPMLLSILAAVVMVFGGRVLGYDEKTMSFLEVYQWTVPVFAAVTFLFYWLALLMDRMRAVVVSQDSSVNVAYNRAKKHLWSKGWLREAWLNTLVVILITAGAFWQKHSFLIFLIAVIAETIIGIVILAGVYGQSRRVDALYEDRKDLTFDTDDDRYWVWGMFYNNPNDKRTMVDKRFGMGTTCNMATRTGKATIIVAVAALIWIPFMCLWMILEDFTPMHLMYENQTVVCMHLKSDFKIPADSVMEAELITELPEGRSKVSGTGTDSMEKGKYSSREIGTYYTFVNCENHAFLKLTTADRIYIICGDDDEETLEIYEELKESL